MAKVNVVLEGRYKDSGIYIDKGHLDIGGCEMTKDTISSYTVLDEISKDQYSLWKGVLGVALLGDIGAVAGVGSKNKREYFISIEWIYEPNHSQGTKSLICLDERCYKTFIRDMF